MTTYLSYLLCSQTDEGGFKNLLSYNPIVDPDPGPASDDCLGRAIWRSAAGSKLLTREMFERALTTAMHLGPRGTALTTLGLANFLAADPTATAARATLSGLADKLVKRYQQEATNDWRWFEPGLGEIIAEAPEGEIFNEAITYIGDA